MFNLGLGLGSVPAEIALAMFDVMMEQEELIDRGERCDKCGKLHLPEDLERGLCNDCAMKIAMEIVEEIEAAIIASIIEEVVEEIMEEEARRQEEEALEEMSELLKLIGLVDMEPSIKLSIGLPF